MNLANTLFFPALSLLIRIKKIGTLSVAVFALVFVLNSCEDSSTEPPQNEKSGIIIQFEHTLDNLPVVFDSLMYQNEAGNPYLVNEIQYFISDVRLYHSSEGEVLIDGWKDIHYVDTDIESTLSWEVYDDLTPGDYDSVSFTFGISEEKNFSFMYVNPPEKDMFWPEFLGGGYHYMKLNGKWLPEGQTVQTTPFDFHLGIGQIYYSYPDSISGFVHNYFNVSLPASGFSIKAGETRVLKLIMRIENWFRQPHTYDHDVFGGYIMQNQEAMQLVKQNGQNVFAIEVLKNEK